MELDLENNLTIIGTKGMCVALFVYIFFYFFKDGIIIIWIIQN